MNFWENLRRAFIRKDPPPMTLFKFLHKNKRELTLSFVDRRRLARNVNCRIEDMRHNRLHVELARGMPQDLFYKEKCHLYFKLPREILKKDLHIINQPSQNGFFCKSSILGCDSDPSGQTRRVWINMPRSYVRRELRRHDRRKVFLGMIADASLWLLPKSERPWAAPKPRYSFDLEAGGPLQLVNISAGGIKVVLDDVDYQEEFAAMEHYDVVLRVRFNLAGRLSPDVWLPCRCISCNYRIDQRHCGLRLEIQCYAQRHACLEAVWLQQGTGQASPKGHDHGMPVLLQWLAARDAIEA